jgi:hypothetical protein
VQQDALLGRSFWYRHWDLQSPCSSPTTPFAITLLLFINHAKQHCQTVLATQIPFAAGTLTLALSN